ncbi:DUF6625 family protein [Epilithonimonas lactis]|uniref:DUF6625 family protein n=1 Tax=Epilithonimonas lactis TaxID=421072 RepID=UPI00068C6783|nr:DUF6625 family protein [Epilithonimonas lactis]SEQ05967.1 hypothetical protein SAMN04488097_1180 [Epilithonimonas lactis]
MKKVAVIIPYFGVLPNWFSAFLDSCKNIELIDFFLFTDDHTTYDFPPNFKMFYLKFSELQSLIKNKLGSDTYISRPYKLCDYKPTYGYLFQEYIANYAYWGHSDVDIIFGDIDKFLEPLLNEGYDRVFPHGHFSVYKNNQDINSLFRTKLNQEYPSIFNFDFVRKTTYPCHFDEIGMNVILKNKKFYDKYLGANVNMNFHNYSVGSGKHTLPEIILYKNGQTIVLSEDNEVREFMYLHLQNRIIQKNIDLSENSLICNDGFIPFSKKDAKHFFEKYGLNNYDEKQKLYQENLKKITAKKQKGKFWKEIYTYNVRGLINIYKRYISIKFLIKNDLF